ncbi:restriction endonuclease subunit S [Serratia sp. D1N4]
MVPEGWKKVPLKTIAEVRSGVAKGKSGLKDPITVQYLRVANVQDGHINLNDVKDIQIERHQLERYSLKFGDVLMNEGGDFDKLGRGDVWQAQIKPCLHQNHVFAVRPIPQEMDSFYLAALAASSYGKKYFLSCAKRSTNLASINSTQLKEFPVLVPPLPEQKKIAKILSAWDKAIATSEQLLANSQQQKKALMQKLLTGNKRLQGYSGDWKQYQLSDITNVIVSPVDKKSVVGEVPVELCNYTDVYYHHEITKEINFMKATASNNEIEKYSLKIGDVIITKDSETPGDIAVPALVSEELNGVVCGYHLAIVRPNKSAVSGAFLNYLFSMPKTRYYFFTLATGATRFGLSIGAINKAQFSLPTVDEQQKIANLLSISDKEIKALKQKLHYLKQEKKALMQQLLTGKRRVKVDAA